MAPWLYRCEAADTIYARDENVIGPEAPPGSEHNVLSRWTNARPRKVVAVSVRALCGWEDGHVSFPKRCGQTSFEASQSQGAGISNFRPQKEGSAEGTCGVT